MRNLRLCLALSVLVSVLAGTASRAVIIVIPPKPIRLGVLRAGVGIVDATWQVGTGSGQYAQKDPNALGLLTGSETDPFFHGATQRHSYGVQSRLSYRALVIEGANGKRVALVKSDSYLAGDYLTRRVVQLLEGKHTGIGLDNILLHVTHNHSSPYYMTPSFGVWLFQDVMDLRTFEYHARAMAQAIEIAASHLRPVRIGATTFAHTIYKGMIARQTITDDGTPGGYPETVNGAGGGGNFRDTVIRVDDVSDASNPKPLAIWMNHGEHPESNDGYNLISADYLGPLERDVLRGTGAPLVFSQHDVGSSEGPYYDRGGNNEILPDGVIRAWAHVGHAQTERGVRYLANDVINAWNEIGQGRGIVPFTTDAPVDSILRFTPGPLSHPYPSVSNCRTEPTVAGNPGAPVLGLPDCQRLGSDFQSVTGQPLPTAPGQSSLFKDLNAAGAPLPANYDATSYEGVEENNRIKLQTIRIGGILLASCSCEAQVDLISNLESRTDAVQGNIYDGFDWSQFCSQNSDTSWTCTKPATIHISDAQYRHMEAQVHNDAKGWNDPSYAPYANAEPSDPALIKGNFTKQELPAQYGYALPVGVGHAGDYDGYTVSYREYMSRDHYRKALTTYGPHTADYMVTNLVQMAGEMNGMPVDFFDSANPSAAAERARLVAIDNVDEARQVAMSSALGAASSAAFDAWVASLPNDLQPSGSRAAVQPPASVKRFSGVEFTWHGGSNAVDNPVVKVQRLVEQRWTDFADASGEVQTMVHFPVGAAGVASAYAGSFDWQWTANFEAFDAFPRSVIPGGQTPDGTYRFVVDGASRSDGQTSGYHVISNPFTVGPWDGISAFDLRSESDGSVSFLVRDTYPRTYSSSFRFISDDRDPHLCKTCSFRPWASSGSVQGALVTVMRADGTVSLVPAFLGPDGRWHAATSLSPGDRASIGTGAIVDSFGEFNGQSYSF